MSSGLGNPLLTTVVMVASFPVVFEMMWSWLIQELDVILYLLAIYSVNALVVRCVYIYIYAFLPEYYVTWTLTLQCELKLHSS